MWTPVLTDRAQLRGSTEYLAKHAVFNIVQNNSEDAYAMLTAHRKQPSFLKGFPQNQLNNQDRNRLGCATSILFPFHLFCPLQLILFCPEPDSEPTEAYENISHCLPKASDQAPSEDEYML